MTNPYSSVAVSGYNADPPSNDASETANNQLDWVLQHKTKLGDPLKTAIESINTNAVNAFARRLGTTFELKTTDYSIAAPGDQGKFFSVTGTTTITLPAVADAGDGFPVGIFNTGSAIVSVDGNASELINGSSSITLPPGLGMLITPDSSEWVGLIYNLDLSQLTTIQGNALAATDRFLVSDAGVAKAIRYQDSGPIIAPEVTVSTNKTFTSAEMNQVHRYNNASDALWDLDTCVGVPSNFLIIIQKAAGSVNLSGGTATINAAVGKFTRVQDSVIVGICEATDVWTFYGDLASA